LAHTGPRELDGHPLGGCGSGFRFSSRLYYPFSKGPGQHIIRCLKNKKCENEPCTQSKALSICPKLLGLIQEIPWTNFASIVAQLWSSITAIFPWTILHSTMIHDLNSSIACCICIFFPLVLGEKDLGTQTVYVTVLWSSHVKSWE